MSTVNTIQASQAQESPARKSPGPKDTTQDSGVTTKAADVLIISPPWRMPDAGCLASATLKPILERDGISCSTLHGSTLFPRTELTGHFLGSFAGHIFTPWVYPDVDRNQIVDTIARQLLDDTLLYGILGDPEKHGLADIGVDPQRFPMAVKDAIDAADTCLNRMMAQVESRTPEDTTEPRFAVVGFSATFEAQLPAAVALAQRLKERFPQMRTMLGGSACFEEMGHAIARAFPCFDAVCHSEGEQVIVPLAQALRDAESVEELAARLAEVPGLAFLNDGDLVVTPSPSLTVDLDALPMPEHREFVAQLAASEWSDQRPRLYFETSRGCWWGERRHCSFCGLNATGMAYRKKSPDRAVTEIQHLYQDYPSARRLECTDNILDTGYLKSVVPRLADTPRAPDRELRIFYEVKSSLRREQLQAMRDAGIDYLQPGIESLSDGVLKLMNKGASALSQVQFLKHAHEVGFYLAWNLLIRVPGEQAAWYREMASLIESLYHLPPPRAVSPIWLERFSPYHTAPERYGIHNIRPRRYYGSLYRGDDANLDQLAYVFDFDHQMQDDQDLLAAHHALIQRVSIWQQTHRPGLLYYLDSTEQLDTTRDRDSMKPDGAGDLSSALEQVTVYQSDGQSETPHPLTADQTRFFLALDRVRTLDSARQATATSARDPISEEEATAWLEDWIQRGWVVSSQDRLLSVVPRDPQPPY